jgi:hypothetical protein
MAEIGRLVGSFLFRQDFQFFWFYHIKLTFYTTEHLYLIFFQSVNHLKDPLIHKSFHKEQWANLVGLFWNLYQLFKQKI